MKSKIDICYLCGQKLDSNIDYDHVPPRQFYAKRIRKAHNLNHLLTLPVHKSCNKFYQNDEDYFVHSLAPLAMSSYTGNAIWEDISNQFKRPQGKRIGQMVLKEFEPRPSGLILPNGKIIKRCNGERICRVAWKITRGLFLKEKERFLPKNTPNLFKYISPGEESPPEFSCVSGTPSKGQYPAVFDYKYISFSEINNFHYWAMLFWNELIIVVAFHDPECMCKRCSDEKSRRGIYEL